MEKAEADQQNLSLPIGNVPRDLLQRFRSGACRDNEEHGANTLASQFAPDDRPGSSEEIELSLGLSMGGRFGTDKHAKKLLRSSSVVGTTPFLRGEDSVTPPSFPSPTLKRTSSLPVETEEEWRKRKELQTLRRMEAKRRRSEKQRNSKLEREKSVSGRLDALAEGSGMDGVRRHGQPCSQGSMDSQCGSSSGMSEMEGKPGKGSSSCEAPSPASTPSLPEQTRGRETSSTAMEDMPCVFTQGDGPDGRRVEGILYKYGRGEEVRIMCVCHGTFLSPAEFVRHAGGGEVAHPLRHIVVNPSSPSFL